MQSPITPLPFEGAHMRAQSFAIGLICCAAFTESLKVLETMKEESLQVSRAYRSSKGNIREGHKDELISLIGDRRNLLTILLSHPIETGV